jgi:hypothetical protein
MARGEAPAACTDADGAGIYKWTASNSLNRSAVARAGLTGRLCCRSHSSTVIALVRAANPDALLDGERRD